MATIRILTASSLILLVFAIAAADTLYLKNGRTFEGKVVSQTATEVKFKTSYGLLSFPKSDVEKIVEGRIPADEYKERLKVLKDDDLAGRLELARWCSEARLRTQMKSLLKGNLKLCPDHPETHLELGEVFRDGKWKAGDAEYPTVERGEPVKLPGSAFEFSPPKKGWSIAASDGKVTATGPDRYATPPVLTLTCLPEVVDPAAAFPEKEGWEKPTEASAGSLSGFVSRRPFTADLIDRTELLAVLTGSGATIRIRLTCLRMEEEVWRAAFDQAIASQKEGLPTADYVNTHYKYQLNLPKPAEEWEWTEDKVKDLIIQHKRHDAIEWSVLMVIGADQGQEWTEQDLLIQLDVEMMKASGDIEKEEEIVLSGVKGKLVQGTYLAGGIPIRGIYVRVEHRKRLYYIKFEQHEYGGEKTLSAYRTVIESFRFTE